MILGIPIVLVGILFIASIWLAPVGILLVFLGAVPFAIVQMNLVKSIDSGQTKKMRRSNEPHTDEPVPPWTLTLVPNEEDDNVVPIRSSKRSKIIEP